MNSLSEPAPSRLAWPYILSTGVLPNSPYVKPAVCDISSPMVGGWPGGPTTWFAVGVHALEDLQILELGDVAAIGSVGFHLPSSYSIIIATPVIGFVIE